MARLYALILLFTCNSFGAFYEIKQKDAGLSLACIICLVILWFAGIDEINRIDKKERQQEVDKLLNELLKKEEV